MFSNLPNSASLGGKVTGVYGPEGAPVTYKVKTVRYVAEYAVEAPDSYSVYGRTDLIVSVV